MHPRSADRMCLGQTFGLAQYRELDIIGFGGYQGRELSSISTCPTEGLLITHLR